VAGSVRGAWDGWCVDRPSRAAADLPDIHGELNPRMVSLPGGAGPDPAVGIAIADDGPHTREPPAAAPRRTWLWRQEPWVTVLAPPGWQPLATLVGAPHAGVSVVLAGQHTAQKKKKKKKKKKKNSEPSCP